MSSPSSKEEHGVSPSLHLIVFVFGVNQENEEAGGVKISLCKSSRVQEFKTS